MATKKKIARQKRALARLEKQLEEFNDQPDSKYSHVPTRQERMEQETRTLLRKLGSATSDGGYVYPKSGEVNDVRDRASIHPDIGDIERLNVVLAIDLIIHR